MPYRSQKKRPQPQKKRLEVTDDNGWTHVTTSGNARRAVRNTSSSSVNNPVLVPADAPRNLSYEELERQFRGHREKWEGSESWRVVKGVIRRTISGHEDQDMAENGDGDGDGVRINAIVCVGLGSPSGFLKGGWVDRRSVSMYQLAALVCVRDLIYELNPQSKPQIYAQDPVFNALDKTLLSSLGITVLEHPKAFQMITPQTLLYCPGAERAHLEQLLPAQPNILFGGPLEDSDSEVIGEFLRTRKGNVRVPGFEGSEHAFWGVRVYFG